MKFLLRASSLFIFILLAVVSCDQFSPSLNLNVGVANLFNVYPDAQDTETETGGVWDAVQMGFSGSLYFVKLGFKF
jgi:iron complex outermembrane recepter protein